MRTGTGPGRRTSRLAARLARPALAGGLLLFFLLDVYQVLSAPGPAGGGSPARSRIFLSVKGPDPSIPRLVAPDPGTPLPPGVYGVQVLCRPVRKAGREILSSFEGTCSLSRSREGGARISGETVLWKKGGTGKPLFLHCRFRGDSAPGKVPPGSKILFFLRYRDLTKGNLCRLEEKAVLVGRKGGRKAVVLRGLGRLARRGRLLAEEELAREAFRKKGAAYLVRRELGLPPARPGWVYTQDGPLAVFQKRLDIPLESLGWMRLTLSEGARLERVNLRVGGGILSAGRIVHWNSLPRQTYKAGDKVLVEVDLSRLGGEDLRREGRLKEIVLGLRGRADRVLREGRVRRIAFFSPSGEGRGGGGALEGLRAWKKDGPGGWKTLNLDLPGLPREVILGFLPGLERAPSGIAFGRSGILVTRPSRVIPLLHGGDSSRPEFRGPVPAGERVLAFHPLAGRRVERSFPRRWSGRGIPPPAGNLEVERGREGGWILSWNLGRRFRGGGFFLRFGRSPLPSWRIEGETLLGGRKMAEFRGYGKAVIRPSGPFDALRFRILGGMGLEPRDLGAVFLTGRDPAEGKDSFLERRPVPGDHPLEVRNPGGPSTLDVRVLGDRLVMKGWWRKGEKGPLRFRTFPGAGFLWAERIFLEVEDLFPSWGAGPWEVSWSPGPGFPEGRGAVTPTGEGKGFLASGPSPSHGRVEGAALASWSILPPPEVRKEGGWVSLEIRVHYRGWRFLSPLEEALDRPLLEIRGRPLRLEATGEPGPEEILRRGFWLCGRLLVPPGAPPLKEFLGFPHHETLSVERVVLKPSGREARLPSGPVPPPTGGEEASGLLSPGRGLEALGLALFLLALLWRRILSLLARAMGILAGASRPGGGPGGRTASSLGFLLAFPAGWLLALAGLEGLSIPFFVFSFYMLALRALPEGSAVDPAGHLEPEGEVPGHGEGTP